MSRLLAAKAHSIELVDAEAYAAMHADLFARVVLTNGHAHHRG